MKMDVDDIRMWGACMRNVELYPQLRSEHSMRFGFNKFAHAAWAPKLHQTLSLR